MKTNQTTPTASASRPNWMDYAPSVYVGTYAKYNAGSIGGEWVNLEGFAGDRAGFLAKCAEIHADEADPELMFQDFQNFPRGFYSESELPEALFEWLDLDEQDRELLTRYQDAIGDNDATIDDARDRFSGTANSVAEFAEQIAEDCGEIPKDIPAWIVIDWESSWNCNLRFDYSTSEAEHGTIYFFHH